MPKPRKIQRALDYAIQSLEHRVHLAAGDLDLNYGTGGFLTGTGAPIEKLVTSPSGIFSLTRTDSTSASDVNVVKVLPNGQPDVSFGVNGEAIIGLATQQDDPIDFVVSSGGQVVVLASRFDPQTSVNEQYILRLNPDGTRDTSLNATGEIVLSNTSSINYASITIDATGSIYAGGGGPGSFLVRKFGPNGAIDGAFGTSGTLTITGTTGSQISQLLIGGGNVFAVGADFSNTSIFARNSATGAAVGGFGSGGVATISAASPVADARLDSQGRIVVMAFEAAGAAVTRFTPVGILDSSFGVGGNVTLGATQFEAMDIGPGDNISVAGTAGNALIVRRLLGANGAIDTSYGASGEATATIPAAVGLPGVSSIVVFVDGSTLVAGGDFEIQDTFYVARFLGDTGNFAVLDTRNGFLTVTGTASPDQLVVDIQGGVTLVAQLGPDQLFFPASAVVQINIDVGGGADVVSITPNVATPANVLLGGGNNSFAGGSGNTTVLGGGGNDSINGGTGNDLIQGFGGSDSITGGNGNDTIDTGSGGDFADGNNGDDSITGGDGPDFIDGAPGNDTLFGRAGPDSLFGADGDDLIFGELGDDTVGGGIGNDTIDAGGGNDFVGAFDGAKMIMGGSGNDTLAGGNDNDTISGGGDNDVVVGNGGADSVIGAAGDDDLNGSAGDDFIDAGDGRDIVQGGPDNDTIDGGLGDDSLIGDAGNDQIFGGVGNDELSGTAGFDTLDAGAGNDRVFGGDGDDMLMGGAGFDSLDGQLGTDFVSGGDGNDLLISDDGTTDQLNGDQGLDIARGDIDEAYTLVEYLYRFVG